MTATKREDTPSQRILIVDDEPAILTSLEDLLEHEFTVLTASDPKVALEMLADLQVAVILTDQRMPGLSGDELLAQAKQVSDATRILITGYADMEALVRAVNRGELYSYVSKPWNPEGLRALIHQAASHFRVRQELEQERRLLRALMDSVPDWIYFKNADLTYSRINRAHAQALGLDDPAEVVGRTDFDFLEQAVAQTIAENERTLLASGSSIVDTVEEVVTATGQRRWSAVTKVPIANASGVEGIVGISRDVTERVRAEQRIKRVATELARSNTELAQFAYVASHDLQAPLRAVVSLLQVLVLRYKSQLDPKAQDLIDRVVANAAHMQKLIDDLLTYGRVGSHGRPLEWTEADEALRRASGFLRHEIESSHAVLTQGELPAVVADPTQLVQIFQNLVGNALKFRGVEPPQIHVDATRGTDEWIFSVRDNGIGIAPGHSERIFRLFQRLQTQSDAPGTGIGLALCKKIVQGRGGRIWVESEPGRGSMFRFTVPDRSVEGEGGGEGCVET